MCLRKDLGNDLAKLAKEHLDTDADGNYRVYKVVRGGMYGEEGLYSVWRHHAWHPGHLVSSRKTMTSSWSEEDLKKNEERTVKYGFHAYTSKEVAQEEANRGYCAPQYLITMTVKPEHLVAIGTWDGDSKSVTVVYSEGHWDGTSETAGDF